VVQRSPIGLQSHPKDRRGSRETSSHGVAREYARFPLLRHPLVRAPLGAQDGVIRQRRIVINSNVTYEERVEFTIFHEIMHYLIDEDGDLIDYLTSLASSDERAFQRNLERFCDAGAGEFLIPRSRVRGLIEERGFSVDLIAALAETSGASILASAIQLGIYSPVDCYVTVCSYGVGPRSPSPGLYVDLSSMRPSMKYVVSRYSLVPRDHHFQQVFSTGESYEGRSFVEFQGTGNRIDMCYSEAVKRGSRVLGILYWKQRPSRPGSGQMALYLF